MSDVMSDAMLGELDEICPLPEAVRLEKQKGGEPAMSSAGLWLPGDPLDDYRQYWPADVVTYHDLDGVGLDDDVEQGPVEIDGKRMRKVHKQLKAIRKSGAINRRRRGELVGYIGENGSGKTLAAVRDTWPTLEEGGRVMSSTMLYDPTTGYENVPHPRCELLSTWRQIHDLRRADLLLDEVQGILNSRASANIPPQLLSAILQLRRRHVRVRWTTPHWSRADVAMREITKAAVLCESYVPDWRAAATSVWRPKLFFVAKLCDAATLDGAGTIQVGQIAPDTGIRMLSRERYWRRRSWAKLYRTTGEAVQILDHLSDSGWCENCGGTKRRAACQCDGGHSTKRGHK